MKVIFLDIDGVLNSDEYIHKARKLGFKGIEEEIDIEKVELLKKLIKISNGNGLNLGEGLSAKDVEDVIERLGRNKIKTFEEER